MYTTTITNLQNIYNFANNSLLTVADNMNANPAHVFEDIKDPLDILAQDIEEQLVALDSNYELQSDTDSEKIEEAVEEHRTRTRRTG